MDRSATNAAADQQHHRVATADHDENLESGATLDQFLAWFPGVARAQAEAVLEHAARSLQAA